MENEANKPEEFTANQISGHLNQILYGQPVGEFRVIITKAVEDAEGNRHGAFTFLAEKLVSEGNLGIAAAEVNKILADKVPQVNLIQVATEIPKE